MALADVRADYTGTNLAMAAPTTSETILAPDAHTGLLVVIGATATTITIVRNGTDAVGLAIADKTWGPLTSTTEIIKVDANFIDPATGNVPVTFSQVTDVTASVVRL